MVFNGQELEGLSVVEVNGTLMKIIDPHIPILEEFTGLSTAEVDQRENLIPASESYYGQVTAFKSHPGVFYIGTMNSGNPGWATIPAVRAATVPKINADVIQLGDGLYRLQEVLAKSVTSDNPLKVVWNTLLNNSTMVEAYSSTTDSFLASDILKNVISYIAEYPVNNNVTTLNVEKLSMPNEVSTTSELASLGDGLVKARMTLEYSAGYGGDDVYRATTNLESFKVVNPVEIAVNESVIKLLEYTTVTEGGMLEELLVKDYDEALSLTTSVFIYESDNE